MPSVVTTRRGTSRLQWRLCPELGLYPGFSAPRTNTLFPCLFEWPEEFVLCRGLRLTQVEQVSSNSLKLLPSCNNAAFTRTYADWFASHAHRFGQKLSARCYKFKVVNKNRWNNCSICWIFGECPRSFEQIEKKCSEVKPVSLSEPLVPVSPKWFFPFVWETLEPNSSEKDVRHRTWNRAGVTLAETQN